MIIIKYPEPQFKIKVEQGKHYIFDAIRKAWLLLTEEEWVRQNFANYLIKELQYPASMIALEKGIVLNDLMKRFDVLVYNHNHEPWMLIECKAPHIHLNDQVMQQVLRYNISIPSTYIVITNGNATFGWQKQGSALREIKELPAWE